MKKLLLTWTLILTMGLLTACGSGTAVVTPPADESAGEPSQETVATGEAVKTGLVVLPDVAKSTDATAEKAGCAQSNMTLVAVTVDDNGVIDACVIDAIQAKIEFGTDGALITDLATTFAGKNELGDEYGMRKASSIGKEWNEQMEALAQYAVGKTVEELKGIALTETGAAADADLAASVTLSIGSYVDAIAQAAETATHRGAVQGDRLALTSVTDMAKSKDAAADAEGLAQAYATIAAVTFHDDVISSCVIDAVQSNVNFDANGVITTDLSVAPQTKNELGDEYGMRKASSIGKEWNEQAEAFAEYVVGKTADEVAGIALNEKGAAADADLAASVTVSLGGFQAIIAKAAV